MKYELILPDGRRFPLQKDWIRIGRADDNDLVIANSTVSRYHVNLYVKPASIIAENAGSQTGFFVNNESISQAKVLNHGDILYLGNAYLTFVRMGENPTPKTKPSNSTGTDKNASLYSMASKAASKGMNNSAENNKRIVIYGVLAAFVAFMVLSEDAEEAAPKSSSKSDAPLAFGLEPLPADSFIKTYSLRSETDMRAEGKFQEGLQDYYNQNYGRARLAFQEAAEFSPQHAKSIEYLAKTDALMLKAINDSIRDAEQSYGLGQLRRARWQAARALGVISQQIPGYARKLAQEADIEAIRRNMAQGQEESLLNIPCEQSLHKDKCNAALKILKQSRRALGDEDLIKRYEQ
jgi:hypothetical protein